MVSASARFRASERFGHEESLVKRTLIFLREVTTAAGFLPCLTVSRKWSRWAGRIQHTVVVLDNKSIGQFVVCSNVRKPSKYSTQSVTIHIDMDLLNPPYVDVLMAVQLAELQFILAYRMPFLSTVSLVIRDRFPHTREAGDGDMEVIRDDPQFAGSRIGLLLKYLPETCVNLEIDTSGLETLIDDEEDHPCPLIAEIMPHMQHLRLRMRQLCSKIIKLPPHVTSGSPLPEPLAPHLRSLILNMELSNTDCPETIRCNPRQTSPEEENPLESEFLHDETPGASPEPSYAGAIQSELTDILRDGYVNKNCFPAANRLMVNDTEFKDPIHWRAMRQVDIREDRRTVHQFMLTPAPEPTELRHWTERDSWRRVHLGSGEWLAGPCALVRDLFDKTWESTDEGSRLPIPVIEEGFEVQFKDPDEFEDPKDIIEGLPRLYPRRAARCPMDLSTYASRTTLARPRTDLSDEIFPKKDSTSSSSDSSSKSPEKMETFF